MKKSIILLLILTPLAVFAQQKYFTRSGHISFYSNAPLQKIEAHNYQATSFLSTSGEIVFSVLINGFEFEKEKMQEDFNANYMQSDKFPKATFNGKIVNISEVNFSKDGTYPVNIEGQMTIHGVTRDLKTTGTLQVQGNKITGKSKFQVAVKDYKITVPSIVNQKIAEVVDVTVDLTYDPYQK